MARLTGGQTVTITIPSTLGILGLTLTPSATFGGATATSCSLVSASIGSPTVSFTCVTPAHVAGLVDVTVTDLLGLINVTGVGAYTYDNGSGPPPVGGNVTVVPNQGPVAGGQTVTITVPSVAGLVGLSLLPNVTFGGNAATGCTPIAATIGTGTVSFTCVTPAHAAGFVDVTVTTTLNLVNATGTNAYEYIANGGPGTTANTTALVSSLNPSTVGQSVTFTATVTGASGTPTGTVTFKDGATTIGTAPSRQRRRHLCDGGPEPDHPPDHGGPTAATPPMRSAPPTPSTRSSTRAAARPSVSGWSSSRSRTPFGCSTPAPSIRMGASTRTRT